MSDMSDNFEIKDSTTLLKLLSQDIDNKDLLNVRVKLAALMDVEFQNIRGRQPSAGITEKLKTVVNRLDRISPIFALEAATYVESVAGAANPTPSKLRDAMANKALNIADRLTKKSGATKETFNIASEAIRAVESWNGYEVSMRAERLRQTVYNRAEKRGFKP